MKNNKTALKYMLFGIIALVLFSSHDMYLKLDQYFLMPNSKSVIALFNGTFEQSDNVITTDRMLDVSLVFNGQRTAIDTSNWYEEGTTTFLNIETTTAGTYLAGVSTRARSLGMSAKDFNDYLEHDGVLDMLDLRNQNGTLGDTAIERYSKHVKTIFQVGDELSDDYQTALGYPIEFIPLENPYDIHAGHQLPVKLLFEQQRLANQLVYVGTQHVDHEHSHDGNSHSHDNDGEHTHDEMLQLRTDEKGIIQVPIDAEGIWYLRTIHLVEIEEAGLTHESNWATLTFAIGEGHEHDHEHDHSHEEGPPIYVFALVSLGLIAILFFVFKRKT